MSCGLLVGLVGSIGLLTMRIEVHDSLVAGRGVDSAGRSEQVGASAMCLVNENRLSEVVSLNIQPIRPIRRCRGLARPSVA